MTPIKKILRILYVLISLCGTSAAATGPIHTGSSHSHYVPGVHTSSQGIYGHGASHSATSSSHGYAGLYGSVGHSTTITGSHSAAPAPTRRTSGYPHYSDSRANSADHIDKYAGERKAAKDAKAKETKDAAAKAAKARSRSKSDRISPAAPTFLPASVPR